MSLDIFSVLFFRHESLTRYQDLPTLASLLPQGRCGWLVHTVASSDSSPPGYRAPGSAWCWILDTQGIWILCEEPLRSALSGRWSCRGYSNWKWLVWRCGCWWQEGRMSRRWLTCRGRNVRHLGLTPPPPYPLLAFVALQEILDKHLPTALTLYHTKKHFTVC